MKAFHDLPLPTFRWQPATATIKVVSFSPPLLGAEMVGSLHKKQKQTKQKIVTSILAIDEKNKNTKKDDGSYVKKKSIQRTVGS